MTNSPDYAVTLTGRARSAHQRSTLLTVCPYILANEFCERLAYYGLSVNLVNYLVAKMHLEPGEAAIQVSVWMGVCYTTPLLGAYLADSVLGRYKTILLFSIVYMLGLTLLSATALVPSLSPSLGQDPSPLQTSLLFLSLYTVALGTGGIKPCVAAFGADQFDENNPRDRREKESFFNWFYFTINLGSLMGSVVVVYVQDRLNLGYGLAIPACAMLFAVFFFVLGTPLYRQVTPNGSPIARVFQVVGAAIRNRLAGARTKASTKDSSGLTVGFLTEEDADTVHAGAVTGTATQWLDHAVQPIPPPVYRSKSLKWLDAAVDEATPLLLPSAARPPKPHRGFSVRQVEEVKLVLRLFPVFFTTMGYWAVFSQMMTMFVEQGMLMDTSLQLPFIGQVHIPPATMFSIDTISIVLLIPAYDVIIEPTIRRVLGKKITLLQKIGWGLVLAITSMLSASVVEHIRLTRSHATPSQGLSILWQIPQFALVGVSEVFGSIGQMEFFYDQAPDVMRSFALALQLSSVAMGSYMSGFLVMAARELSGAIGRDWLPRDLNNGRLDLFFLFIAGALTLNLLVFLWVACVYEYKALPHGEPPNHEQQQQQDEDITSSVMGATVSIGVAPMPISSPATPTPITSRQVSQDEEAESGIRQPFSRSLAQMPESPPKLAPLR